MTSRQAVTGEKCFGIVHEVPTEGAVTIAGSTATIRSTKKRDWLSQECMKLMVRIPINFKVIQQGELEDIQCVQKFWPIVYGRWFRWRRWGPVYLGWNAVPEISNGGVVLAINWDPVGSIITVGEWFCGSINV